MLSKLLFLIYYHHKTLCLGQLFSGIKDMALLFCLISETGFKMTISTTNCCKKKEICPEIDSSPDVNSNSLTCDDTSSMPFNSQPNVNLWFLFLFDHILYIKKSFIFTLVFETLYHFYNIVLIYSFFEGVYPYS